MRRITLAALSAATALSLGGCGLPQVIDLMNDKDEPTPSAVPTSAATSSTQSSTRSTSAKPSSTRSSSTRSSSTKSSATKSPDKTHAVDIPPEQQSVIMDALSPLVKAHITDPNTDTMSGKIRFDKDMAPTSFTNFKLNEKPITVDSAAKKEAEQVFAKLSGTPKEDRFSELEFTFSKGKIEASALYPFK